MGTGDATFPFAFIGAPCACGIVRPTYEPNGYVYGPVRLDTSNTTGNRLMGYIFNIGTSSITTRTIYF